MDATSAAAAQCHYQSGRYHDALVILEWQEPSQPQLPKRLGAVEKSTPCEQNKWITVDDAHAIKATPLILRAELASLPLSARHADITMCRFRSAIHSSRFTDHNAVSSVDASSGQNQSAMKLWMDALKASSNYMRALSSSASSLMNTCFIEMEFLHQVKHQSASSYSETTQQRNHEHISIQNAMKSTAVSILMTGVASSHLHLYESGQQLDSTAWNVLVESAIMAADLMCARTEFIRSISGEKPEITIERGTLESSLCILNEVLVDERSAVALHSFRSALKVAALACGRLVLPKIDLKIEGTVNEPAKKRPRKKSDEIQHQYASKKNDAWNAIYVHENTALHSCERLVDALTSHSALVHCTAKLQQQKSSSVVDMASTLDELFHKREKCFDESILLELKMKALLVDETSSEPVEDASGFAGKIHTCIRSLEYADRSLQSIDHNKRTDRSNIFSVLEGLVSSSTSRFACEMVGCIHVQHGEYSSAIEMFQLALDRCEQSYEERLFYNDVESNHELTRRRIASNMAYCFVAQGCAEVALEILIDVWSSSNESNENYRTNPQPKALLLARRSNQIENVEAVYSTVARMKLLWMIYHVASIASDWQTCLQVTELLREHWDQDDDMNITSHVRVDWAAVFSLLQCRRERESRELAQESSARLSRMEVDHVLGIVVSTIVDLYTADISLSLENRTENLRTNRTMDLMKLRSTAGIRSIHELRVIFLNNLGLNCIIEQNAVGALRYFREASELLTTAQSTINDHSLLVPIHFNLALLFLRDGRIEDSAKIWLSVRGFLDTWEAAKRSDTDSLSKLRESHLLSMNRHGMVMAKRNMIGASKSLNQITVSSWVAPVVLEQAWQEDSTYINGVDSAQICTLDFILLKYALSCAEKKSNNNFFTLR